MKNQQGAALVIVMALLSGALMVGISGMNSALIDERLAGNYRAAAIAQMNAERAASDSVTNDIFIGSSNGQGQEFWNDEPAKNLLKNNLKEIIESDNNIHDWKDVVRGFRYEDIKENFDVVSQYNENVCSDGDYNRCLYFPVYIDVESGAPEWYVIAFGAIESEQGNVIAQSSPIFIKFSSTSSGGVGLPFDSDVLEEAIGVFDKIGMFAGEDIDIDNQGKYDFIGLLQADDEFDVGNENNFIFDGDGSGEVSQNDKESFPVVNFDSIIEEVKQTANPVGGYDEDCVIAPFGDQEGEVIFCDGDVELSGNFSNVFIVADGDVNIIGDTALENVFIVSNEDIENENEKNDFASKNSFFFSKDGVDLDLKGKNTIDGLWIYSGDDIDIDVKGGGNEEWIGGLMAKSDIDFDTNGRYNFRHASASTTFSQSDAGAGSSSNPGLTVVSWES
ncbi:PilX N-terminal [Halomonas sp. NYA30]